MSRILKYQEGMRKFIKTKSFAMNASEPTQNMLNDMIENDEHFPAILCLTILNNQCKKNDVKIHGYYLASGVNALMMVAKICSSRDHYEQFYGQDVVDNAIIEIINSFYPCITQNINTLSLSKNGNISTKMTQLCIEYASKHIPLITQKIIYKSTSKMKKTDLLCMNINEKQYNSYKQMKFLEKPTLLEETVKRYGSVCKLAMGLGWFLGQNDDVVINKLKDLGSDKTIEKLEKLGDKMGRFFKLHDDFRNITRDIQSGRFSLNYVVNHGIKEAYAELIELKASLIEESMCLEVETRTSKEIIDIVVKDIEEVVKDVSVDMKTHYDDVSTI